MGTHVDKSFASRSLYIAKAVSLVVQMTTLVLLRVGQILLFALLTHNGICETATQILCTYVVTNLICSKDLLLCFGEPHVTVTPMCPQCCQRHSVCCGVTYVKPSAWQHFITLVPCCTDGCREWVMNFVLQLC